MRIRQLALAFGLMALLNACGDSGTGNGGGDGGTGGAAGEGGSGGAAGDGGSGGAAGEGGSGGAAGEGGSGGAAGEGGSSGTPLCQDVVCDDGNDCTEEACDPSDGLCDYVEVANGTSCDFGGRSGICDEGVCKDAMRCAGVDCDDGNECTEDRCNPVNGNCSHSSAGANGESCSGGAGVCMSGDCELVAQTKQFSTRCTDLVFQYAADIPVDLTVAPANSYTDGASSTTLQASFRLDQGLGTFLVGLGIDSTEITALQVDVQLSGATPTTLVLPSEQTPPFTVDFSTADTVNTRSLVRTVTPNGLAPHVDFTVSDWNLGIVIENMGVPIYTSLSPADTGPIFSCGPLVPVNGSIRYPQ